MREIAIVSRIAVTSLINKRGQTGMPSGINTNVSSTTA